jgi:SAM-dependent methyltransferase
MTAEHRDFTDPPIRSGINSTFARFSKRRMTPTFISIEDPSTRVQGSDTTSTSLYSFLSVTAAFAGVGNPHAISQIGPGAVVLDIGCGAGTDLLLAARRIGPSGRALGIDMTVAMRERAMSGAQACGLTNVDIRDGDAMNLPVEDSTVDVVKQSSSASSLPPVSRAYASSTSSIASQEQQRNVRPNGTVSLE